MPPCTVEFSEICPSGKGYIPVEGAWMFGQTTYTGNLPKTLLPKHHSPQWAQPGSPGGLCVQTPPLRLLLTFLSQGCRSLAGSSDLSYSWIVQATPLWFLCSLRLSPPGTSYDALTNPVPGHSDRGQRQLLISLAPLTEPETLGNSSSERVVQVWTHT